MTKPSGISAGAMSVETSLWLSAHPVALRCAAASQWFSRRKKQPIRIMRNTCPVIRKTAKGINARAGSVPLTISLSSGSRPVRNQKQSSRSVIPV